MEPEIGDEIIVGSIQPELPGRVATIVSVCVTDDSRRYLVHWLAGDYDAMISPGPATKVEVLHKSHLASAQAESRRRSAYFPANQLT
jgi:hypothetical protein